MKLGYRACSIRIRKRGKRSIVTFFFLFGQVEEEEEEEEAGLGFPSPSILFPLWSLPRPLFEKGKRRRRKATKTKMVSARWGPGKKRREGRATGENKKKEEKTWLSPSAVTPAGTFSF